jgi:hypothetical protein
MAVVYNYNYNDDSSDESVGDIYNLDLSNLYIEGPQLASMGGGIGSKNCYASIKRKSTEKSGNDWSVSSVTYHIGHYVYDMLGGTAYDNAIASWNNKDFFNAVIWTINGVGQECLTLFTFGKWGAATKAGRIGSKAIGYSATKQASFGKLKFIGKDTWESSQGLIYGYDKKFGNRVLHVLAHGTPNPSKATHTVFNVSKDKILGLIDEAWKMKGSPLSNDPGAYVINMGKIIGTAGETIIKIVIKPGTSEIISAFPIK